MLDLKKIKAEEEKVVSLLNRRGKDFSNVVSNVLEINEERRKTMEVLENLRFKQNKINKSIPTLKKEDKNIENTFKDLKKLSDEISSYSVKVTELLEKENSILLGIPNVPSEDIPVGKSDADNLEIKKVGDIPNFDFKPKPHWDIGTDLGILDFKRASKITGSRFTVAKGLGAKLERAIITFFLDTHARNGFKEILPPYIVNSKSMTGTGQLPKFKEDAFKLENSDYYLIPTAEVPVTNLHSNEIIKEEDLPIKYCAYSACFRAEAGSAGRDTRGIVRQHQFNKVELVKFTHPEDSENELETLLNEAELVLKILKLPYRVVTLCTGDLGFSASKTYDIEVWMPSYNRYVEISSCSNFSDFQSRRANIKYRDSKTGKNAFVHTLNGSGLAVGRTLAAILENYQTKEGSVLIPDALKDYMKTDIISIENAF